MTQANVRRTDWLAHNANRSYPLLESSSGQSTDGLFTIPNDLFVSLYLHIGTQTDLDRSRFYISRLSNGGQELRWEVAYLPQNGLSVPVAYGTFRYAGGTGPFFFQLFRAPGWSNLEGFGLLDEMPLSDDLPLGDFEFDFNETALEPDVVSFLAESVSSVQIVDGGQQSTFLTGSIAVRAGESVFLQEQTDEDTGVSDFVFNAADLNEAELLCGCIDQTNTALSSVNNLLPGEDGNVDFVGLKCVEVINSDVVYLETTCGEPCCACDEVQPIIDILHRSRDQSRDSELLADRLEGDISAILQRLGRVAPIAPQLPPITTTTTAAPTTTQPPTTTTQQPTSTTGPTTTAGPTTTTGPATTTTAGPTTTTPVGMTTTTAAPTTTTAAPTTTTPAPTTTTSVPMQTFFPETDLIMGGFPNGLYAIDANTANWPVARRLFAAPMQGFNAVAVSLVTEEIAAARVAYPIGIQNPRYSIDFYNFAGQLTRTVGYPSIQVPEVHGISFNQSSGELLVLGDSGISRIPAGQQTATRDSRFHAAIPDHFITSCADTMVGDYLVVSTTTAVFAVNLDTWSGNRDDLLQLCTIPQTLTTPDVTSLAMINAAPDGQGIQLMTARRNGHMFLSPSVDTGLTDMGHIDTQAAPLEVQYSFPVMTSFGYRYAYTMGRDQNSQSRLGRFDLNQANLNTGRTANQGYLDEFIANTGEAFQAKCIACARANPDVVVDWSGSTTPPIGAYERFNAATSSLQQPARFYRSGYTSGQQTPANFSNADMLTELIVQPNSNAFLNAVDGVSGDNSTLFTTSDLVAPDHWIVVDNNASVEYILEVSGRKIFDAGPNPAFFVNDIDIPSSFPAVVMSTDSDYDGLVLSAIVNEPPYVGNTSVASSLKFRVDVSAADPRGPSYAPPYPTNNPLPVSTFGAVPREIQNIQTTSFTEDNLQFITRRGLRHRIEYIDSLRAHSSGRTIVTLRRQDPSWPVQYYDNDVVFLRGDTTDTANMSALVDNGYEDELTDSEIIIRYPYADIAAAQPRYLTRLDSKIDSHTQWAPGAFYMRNWTGDKLRPLLFEFSCGVSGHALGYMCFIFNSGGATVGSSPVENLYCVAVHTDTQIVNRPDLNASNPFLDELALNLSYGYVNVVGTYTKLGDLVRLPVAYKAQATPDFTRSQFVVWLRHNLQTRRVDTGIADILAPNEVSSSFGSHADIGNYYGVSHDGNSAVFSCEDILIRSDPDDGSFGRTSFGHFINK